MADNKWRGDAQPRRQLTRVTVANVEVGDVFTLTINRKDVSYTATVASEANVYDGLAGLVGSGSTIPEFRNVFPRRSYKGQSGLWMEGPADGSPFTLAISSTDGGQPTVVVTEQTQGAPGANCKQLIEVTATGGTFTVSFLGVVTSGIAFNASAATVQTALRGLSSVGSSGCSVTDGGTSGNTRRWIVEFTGALALASQPLLVTNGGGLTGVISGVVTELVKGAAGTNHRYRLTPDYGQSISGNVTFEFRSPLSGGVSYGSVYVYRAVDNSTDIRNVLQQMFTIGVGNVLVTPSQTVALAYDIEFVGSFAGQDITNGIGWFVVNQTTLPAATLDETQTGSTTTTNEKQTITFSSVPSGGTWTAAFNGQTTSSLAHNISAANLQTALQGLSTIGSGNCVVTSVTSPSGQIVWTVEFTNARGGTDQPLIVAATTLNGGPAIVTLIVAGAGRVNESQIITITGAPASGTFTLTFGANATANIAYNAAASVVQAALEALASIGTGNIAVSGLPGGPYAATFQGALAGANVDMMSGDGASLVAGAGTQSTSLSSIINPTGPAWYSEPENWSLGNVPGAGDTVVFENSSNPCLYGLDQSATTPAGFRIEASYTGQIGLPDVNTLGYVEYLPRRLRIGNAGALTIAIGVGDGPGSSRIRLDTGSGCAVTIDVWQTSSSIEEGVAALDWIGAHANNAMRVYRGEVSIATGAGEAAILASLTMSYVDSQASDASISIGGNVTLTNVTKQGGYLDCESGISGTLNHWFGDCLLRGTGGVGTVNSYGGTVEYATSGTLGTLAIEGDGLVSFDRDARPKTITNIPTIDGDNANMRDQFRSLKVNGTSPAALVIDYTNTTRFPDLGRDVRVTRIN